MSKYLAPNMLQGKKAIVTGATSGIGRAIALQFAYSGAFVACIGTNEDRGAQVVEEIHQLTGQPNAIFRSVDVSNTQQVASCLQSILDLWGGVDILVNNAGITRDKLLIRITEQDWDQVLATNAKSCYNCTHALLRSMMEARTGSIINISSIVGLKGGAGQANYAASKAAMIGFTKALAEEVGSRGIRVNAICPGFIDTSMTHVLSDQRKQKILEKIPLGRMGTPEEVAYCALMLAGPMGSYITGQTFIVDGGLI